MLGNEPKKKKKAIKLFKRKNIICNSTFGEFTSSERARGWLGEEEHLLRQMIIHRSTVPCQDFLINISLLNASLG